MEIKMESTRITLKTVDWKGNPKEIPEVLVERDPKTGRILVEPEEVAKADFNQMAKELHILPRDIALFLLLYSKPGPFQRGYLCQKYKLNKMLFYQWKELEREGFADTLPHDEFEAKERGPVPKNLWDDLKRLRDEGLLDVEGHKKEKTSEGKKKGKTVTVELTNKGEAISKKLRSQIADPYITVTGKVKDWLFPLTPEHIKERVHKDYPEYRKTYKCDDTEEILEI